MSLQMASSKFSYHRLESAGDVELREDVYEERPGGGRLRRKRSWWRVRRVSRRRPRIRIPSLRRFFSRRKARQLSAAWIKIWKRLKESRSCMGDLFAGNYLFMQVTPSPLGCLERTFMGHDQHGKYPLPEVHVRPIRI